MTKWKIALIFVHWILLPRLLLCSCHISCRSWQNAKNRIYNFIDPGLASWLQSLYHRLNMASLCLFYKYFQSNWSNLLFSLAARPHKFKRGTWLRGRYHHLTVEIAWRSCKLYSNSSTLALLACWTLFWVLLSCQRRSSKI